MNQALPSQVRCTLGKATGTGGTAQAPPFPGPGLLGLREDSMDTIFGQEPTQGAPAAAWAGPAGGAGQMLLRTPASPRQSAAGEQGTLRPSSAN